MARLRRAVPFVVGFTALLLGQPAKASAQFTNKLTTTPILIQDDFGFGGRKLPNDGLAYCGPTSMAMSMQWLGINGWTQLSPARPTVADGLNLDRVLAGFMETSAFGGTTGDGYTGGIQAYLSAKGIAPGSYTLTYYDAPTVSLLNSLNRQQTVLNLVTGWYSYDADTGEYNRTGGHFLTLRGQDVPRQRVLINNSAPASLAPGADLPQFSRQTLQAVPFTGTSPDLTPGLSYLQWDPRQFGGYLGQTTAIFEGAFSLTLNLNTRNRAGWTPAPWLLAAPQGFNTNGGDLTVIAALQGAGAIQKSGLGTLSLLAANSTTGDNQIAGGRVTSSLASGTPMGTGSLAMNYGRLDLLPSGSGAAAALSLASGPGEQLSYGGGAVLGFSRGSRAALTVLVGGNVDGSTPNLVRSGTGTLVIAPGGGMASLGTSERLLLNGSPAGGVPLSGSGAGLPHAANGNLPAMTNGMVSPAIVGQDNDAQRSGDFLTYSSAGFAKANYTLSSTTPINSAAANSVYEVNSSQTLLPGSSAQIFALKVGPFAIGSGGGETVLRVGENLANRTAGLILNGGSIAATRLDFGASEAVVYASTAGGTISSVIQGEAGLVKFGPGTLTLTGSNAYAGTTVIQSGVLAAANTSGSATGAGPVRVNTEAELRVLSGAQVHGNVQASAGGTITLAGGSLAGGAEVDSLSTLAGFGTIHGTASVNGNIVAGSQVGQLTFTDSVFFNRANSDQAALFTMTLARLTDDPSRAGIDWNTLLFSTQSGTLDIGVEGAGVALGIDFDLVPDPNSGHGFWNQPHSWTIFTAPFQFNEFWYSLEVPTFLQGTFGVNVNPAFTEVAITYQPFPPHRFGGFSTIPEPSSLLLLGGAGMAAAWLHRRGRASRRHQ